MIYKVLIGILLIILQFYRSRIADISSCMKNTFIRQQQKEKKAPRPPQIFTDVIEIKKEDVPVICIISSELSTSYNYQRTFRLKSLITFICGPSQENSNVFH